MWNETLNTTYESQSGRMQNQIGLNLDQIDESILLAGESTREVLREEANAGNVDQIISLFRGKHETSSSHPLSKKIENRLVAKIQDRQGLSEGVAQEIHHTVVPYILSQLKSRMIGAGTAPSPQSLSALFGGPGILSEGLQDKMIKEFERGA